MHDARSGAESHIWAQSRLLEAGPRQAADNPPDSGSQGASAAPIGSCQRGLPIYPPPRRGAASGTGGRMVPARALGLLLCVQLCGGEWWGWPWGRGWPWGSGQAVGQGAAVGQAPRGLSKVPGVARRQRGAAAGGWRRALRRPGGGEARGRVGLRLQLRLRLGPPRRRRGVPAAALRCGGPGIPVRPVWAGQGTHLAAPLLLPWL